MDDLDCFHKLMEQVNPNDQDELMRSLINVDWNEGGKVHNWRNYVPDVVQEIWENLSSLGMLSIYVMAKERADREDWD